MFGGKYNNAKVLVTGNTGFKGSWLCLWLQQLGAEVVGLADAIPTSPALYTILKLEDTIKQHWVDVRNAEAVLDAVRAEAPDIIFHMAARSVVRHGFIDPLGTLAVNAMGTANVLDAVRQIGNPCSVVVVTSDKCYDNKEWPWGYRETDALGGKDIYSASKASAEHIAHAYVSSFFGGDDAIRVVTARSGNVIGGGDWSDHRIIPDFIRAIEAGKKMDLRHPEATRPWQFVLEPVSAYLRLGQLLLTSAKIHGEAYNFGPGYANSITVATLLETLNERMTDKPLADVVIQSEDKDHREAGLLKLTWDKAHAQLQWAPVLSYSETMDLTADWYRAYLAGSDMLALTQQQIEGYFNKAINQHLTWAS